MSDEVITYLLLGGLALCVVILAFAVLVLLFPAPAKEEDWDVKP